MRARFGEIAHDVALTVDRDDPIAGLSKEQTASLMLSISWHESAWRRDIDLGETTGTQGDSCIMQLLGAPKEARTNRLVCLREGLKKMKQSWRACAASPERDRLAAYASGGCIFGMKESEAMVDQWKRWLGAHPPTRKVARR